MKEFISQMRLVSEILKILEKHRFKKLTFKQVNDITKAADMIIETLRTPESKK